MPLIFSKEMFNVIEAVSREEFEINLKKGGFDLILSDFNILGFEGFQVIEFIKKANPSLPVIIVAGTDSEEVATEAINHGAVDYIVKTPREIQRLPHIKKKCLRMNSWNLCATRQTMRFVKVKINSNVLSNFQTLVTRLLIFQVK